MVGIGFNELDDLVLLVTRQLVGLVERLPELAGGSLGRRLLGVWTTQQVIGADAQCVGQGRQLFGAQGDGLTLPVGDDALGQSKGTGIFVCKNAPKRNATYLL